jgi:hypothetical protein
MLEITYIHYDMEEDSFEEGCIASYRSDGYSFKIEAETPEALYTKIMAQFDVDRDSLDINACEEAGRIDVQRTEDAEGNQASATQIEQWKRGELKLYLADYSVYVEEVTRKPATLK